MSWYGWLALALGLWGVISVIAGLAAGRMIGEAATAGMSALEAPPAKPVGAPEPSMATLTVGAH
jgi:hypothetical protein